MTLQFDLLIKDSTYQALIYDRLEYVEMLVNHPNLDPHEKDKVGWIRSPRFILCLTDIYLYCICSCYGIAAVKSALTFSYHIILNSS